LKTPKRAQKAPKREPKSLSRWQIRGRRAKKAQNAAKWRQSAILKASKHDLEIARCAGLRRLTAPNGEKLLAAYRKTCGKRIRRVQFIHLAFRQAALQAAPCVAVPPGKRPAKSLIFGKIAGFVRRRGAMKGHLWVKVDCGGKRPRPFDAHNVYVEQTTRLQAL
jgi:hypothetical protein